MTSSSSTDTYCRSGETSTPPPPSSNTVASLELKLCTTTTTGTTNLTVSLYHVELSSSCSSSSPSNHNNIFHELCHITTQLRENEEKNNNQKVNSNFAIMDARRIISWNQLVIAANMAFVPRSSFKSSQRRSSSSSRPRPAQDIWSVVLNAAGSTHFGHVLRDYAFGELPQQQQQPQEEESSSTTNNENDPTTTKMIPIVALSTGTTMDQHTSTFTKLLSSRHNLHCTLQPLSTLQQDNDNDDHKSKSSTAQFSKWYKLTPKEIETTSLEKAILTKIATKFYI
mmetsp:Transcript_26457/g.37148  ORF Transcript_26457/g.37148 Transcript_26457/m.37148 type:complete len:283 (-) Transcript_26457:481-1329(-)